MCAATFAPEVGALGRDESNGGRGGLEPPASAVIRAERCASRVEGPGVRRGVMWPGLTPRKSGSAHILPGRWRGRVITTGGSLSTTRAAEGARVVN